MTMNRRENLALLAGVGGLVACAERGGGRPNAAAKAIFKHGVASGDPQTDSIVLWTRVEPAPAFQTVAWVLAEDENLGRVVAEGQVQTGAATDFTVKVTPNRLKPGQTYYYAFTCQGEQSPIGRTKTLPEGSLQKLGIALVSCSNYAFGHFNAYGLIADDPAVDVVLHTGDYIYEYGADGWGKETGSVLGRNHQPPHEIVSLSDYRQRHAQYKTDPQSQRMHAAHPFVACWDDHEVANNPWLGGAQNHQPETEGDWQARRTAALQAYYEWMPLRDPKDDDARRNLFRAYSFGDLATLVTLESRHTGRGEQVDYRLYADRLTDEAQREAFMTNVIGDPLRTMLSNDMERALKTALDQSVAMEQPWRLIGNASPIARMLVPDITPLGVDPATLRDDTVRQAWAFLSWKSRWNLPFYTDTWDGYPAAREALYDLAHEAGAEDLVFLTGDSHSFWLNQLADDSGAPRGIELGTAGVSSPGDFVETGYGPGLSERLDRFFEDHLPEVLWTDNLHQGYVRLTLNQDHGRADFVASDSVLQPTSGSTVLKSVQLTKRGNRVVIST